MMWKQASEWERNWWDTCQNSYGEEEKQLVYAAKMGLTFFHDGRSPYNIDMGGRSVLDIGGGPVSLLLKCINVKGTVIDPCDYPDWVACRYRAAGIRYQRIQGENLSPLERVDEAWLYNVLQHTEIPALVVANARKAAKVVRVFEWIDTVANQGHPHILTEATLNEWLGGYGKVEELNLPTLKGRCYYGVFRGGI